MKRKKQDTDFMEDLAAIRAKTPDRAATLFLLTVLGTVLLFFIWAGWAKVDEISRGSGVVVPSMNAQVVQSLEGGILQELLVKEGDTVKKGQVLLRLSDVAFASEERGTQARLLALQARRARLQAEAEEKDFTLPEDIQQKAPQIAENERSLYLSRQEEYKNALTMIDKKTEGIEAQIEGLKAEIAKESQNAALIGKELAITRKMVAQKALPEIEEIRLRREQNEALGNVKTAQERKSGLMADLAGAQKQKKDQADKFRSQALGELNETETELSGLQENLKSIGDRVDRAEIKSPVDGIVNNIALTTIGGVVEPAMRLAEIVPSGDDLKIRARVTPNDIAFLKVGQKARVKISAYDSARYGDLEGELIRVGANSVSGKEGAVYFEIEVRTNRNFLGTADHPLPVGAGMIAEVSIITGHKSVLEYLLKPFLRLQDRALTER